MHAIMRSLAAMSTVVFVMATAARGQDNVPAALTFAQPNTSIVVAPNTFLLG